MYILLYGTPVLPRVFSTGTSSCTHIDLTRHLQCLLLACPSSPDPTLACQWRLGHSRAKLNEMHGLAGCGVDNVIGVWRVHKKWVRRTTGM